MREVTPLPRLFCWTRFGTEAGEPIEAILERKERERRDSGSFFWGIGNSVGPGIQELLRRTNRPEVLFSPIRSRPRVVDVNPPSLTRWRAGTDLDGKRVVLPEAARVMSGHARRAHYALVCHSDEPLRLEDVGRIRFGALRNLVSGNPLGASQVTAVVELMQPSPADGEYPVALRARLVSPYFVRLDERAADAAVDFTLAA